MFHEVNFDSKYPPIREVSRRTGSAFGGCASKMADCASRGCLQNCGRSFTESTFCQMMVSTLIAFSVKDSVVIMHGPAGCGAQSHSVDFNIKLYGAARGIKMEGARWYTTNLSEPEIIGGGEKRLEEAILDADKNFRPSAIFVLSTCTPAIIGDDIDDVISRMQPNVTATLVPLHCPGFKTKVFSSAYDVVYHGILQKFQFTPEAYLDYKPIPAYDKDYELKLQQYAYKKSRTVNLFNAWSIGPADEAEIKRLLEAIGLNVQIFVEFKHPDEWRLVTEAALNVCLCHVHDLYFLEFLKQKLGMPFITPDIPIGTAATRGFIMGIAKFFGLEKEAEAVISKEEARIKPALAPIREKVAGKKVLLSGGYLRIGATALLAGEIGMEVVGLRSFNYDEFGNRLFGEIEETLGDVGTSISSQPSELVNVIRRIKPDIAVSHTGVGVWVTKAGVPSITLFAQRFPIFGYKGAYDLARRIERTLQNPNFSRNLSRNIALPFKKEWFETDPYKYIQADF